MPAAQNFPARGEIWFVRMPTDPPDKGPRPVVIVSVEARNSNPRANSVLVVPLSTSPKRAYTHVEFSAGETGLGEDSVAKTEEIGAVPKAALQPPRYALRKVSELRIRDLAGGALIAMGAR